MKLSNLARPPIQSHETDGAETAICCNHGGLIRLTGDRDGRVFFCPKGGEFWRYSAKPQSGMYVPLPYGPEARI